MTGTPAYDALLRHGIHPGVSLQDVEAVRELTRPAESEAWQTLHDPYSRLAADFYLYRVNDPKNWRAALLRRIDGEEIEFKRLRQELGRDAPLFLLLAGHREVARDWMEARFRTDLFDTRTAHDLAIYWNAEAHHQEAIGNPDQALKAWHPAIAYLCRVLVDGSYWQQWTSSRQRVYRRSTLSTDRVEGVRTELRTRVANHLRRRSEQFREVGDRRQADMFQDLEMSLEVEWRAVTAMREAAQAIPDVLTVGPLLLTAAGLDLAHAEIFSPFRSSAGESGLRFDEEQRRTIRQSFSGLAKMAVLLETGRIEEAISHLQALPSTYQAARDPGYSVLTDPESEFISDATSLAIRGLISRARDAMPPAASDGELRARFKAVLNFGCEKGREQEAVQAIAVLAVGSAKKFTEEESTSDTMSLAIKVLEAAFAVIGGDISDLSLALADMLQSRGDLRYEVHLYEESYSDLRRAWNLYPDNESIVVALCWTLYHWAVELREGGDRLAARERLKEGLRGLAEKSGPRYVEVRRMLVHEQDVLNGLDPAKEYWGILEEALREKAVEPAKGETDLNRADACVNSGNLAGAFDALVQAMPTALRNNHLWGRCSSIVLELFRKGGANAATELMNRFATLGAGHNGFQMLRESIVLASGMLEGDDGDAAGS